jgi:hypothetical protein
MWGMYQWLDRAPLGRNEKGIWWKHHDRYLPAELRPEARSAAGRSNLPERQR